MAPSIADAPVPDTTATAPKSAKPARPVQKSRTMSHDGSAVPDAEAVLPELRTEHREPLKLSGALDGLEHFDVTPVIGREYVDANLVDLLRAENSDDLIRDLAITSTVSPL